VITQRWQADHRPSGEAKQFAVSIKYEGGRYDRAPFATRSRPPNGASVINQVLGAMGAVFFLLILWLFEALWLFVL